MTDKKEVKNLKKRYLIWLYKETKEALDRVDRKFTQLEVDKVILAELKKAELKDKKFLDDFYAYVNNKEKDCGKLKSGKNYSDPEHQFLALKLQAVEKAIVKELGAKSLEEIKTLYHNEMVDRILRSTEHR